MTNHSPVDQQCPDVEDFTETLFGDPLTEAMGAPVDEIMEDFETKHRIGCKRCQDYGAANMEVVE